MKSRIVMIECAGYIFWQLFCEKYILLALNLVGYKMHCCLRSVILSSEYSYLLLLIILLYLLVMYNIMYNIMI